MGRAFRRRLFAPGAFAPASQFRSSILEPLLRWLEEHKEKRVQALETLATKNYGFALFQAIEQAKRQLSTQAASTIKRQLAELPLAVALLREEFNRLIEYERAEVRRDIREATA